MFDTDMNNQDRHWRKEIDPFLLMLAKSFQYKVQY